MNLIGTQQTQGFLDYIVDFLEFWLGELLLLLPSGEIWGEVTSTLIYNTDLFAAGTMNDLSRNIIIKI